jgi:hypothetical protein
MKKNYDFSKGTKNPFAKRLKSQNPSKGTTSPAKDDLPKRPDAVITTLLARALLFLTHATQHSRLNSPLDRMVSVHSLDNSVEYLLRIVVQHLDIETATGKTLDTTELAALVSCL